MDHGKKGGSKVLKCLYAEKSRQSRAWVDRGCDQTDGKRKHLDTSLRHVRSRKENINDCSGIGREEKKKERTADG